MDAELSQHGFDVPAHGVWADVEYLRDLARAAPGAGDDRCDSHLARREPVPVPQLLGAELTRTAASKPDDEHRTIGSTVAVYGRSANPIFHSRRAQLEREWGVLDAQCNRSACGRHG